MQSFSRGWSFLKQAWSMAFKDKDLLKPSIYALVAGAVVSVIGIVPIVLLAMLVGGSNIGNVIVALAGGVMIFLQFIVSYVFSGMTAYLIYADPLGARARPVGLRRDLPAVPVPHRGRSRHRRQLPRRQVRVQPAAARQGQPGGDLARPGRRCSSLYQLPR